MASVSKNVTLFRRHTQWKSYSFTKLTEPTNGRLRKATTKFYTGQRNLIKSAFVLLALDLFLQDSYNFKISAVPVLFCRVYSLELYQTFSYRACHKQIHLHGYIPVSKTFFRTQSAAFTAEVDQYVI